MSLPKPNQWRLGRLALLALLLAACSPESLVGDDLPPNVPDPGATKTPDGAVAAYYGAILEFNKAFGGNTSTDGPFVVTTGLLTDELQDGNLGLTGSYSSTMSTDSRVLPNDVASSANQYATFQRVRGQTQEAQGALATYAPDAPPALIGHLNAIEGFADIFLADLYCSGIPLSTLIYEGDYELAAGSTTHEVYESALTLFDSAIAVTGDSARLLYLAQVGKGRALLALGRYEEAAAAVASVPDDFSYEATYGTLSESGNDTRNFAYQFNTVSMPWTVADQEGTNGLPFISSNDPRSATEKTTKNKYGLQRYRPTRYATTGDSPIVVASGIEARLIEAEAALHAGDPNWLDILNTLRTTGDFTGVDTVVARVDTTVVSGVTQVDTTFRYDTLWVAGTGGVARLGPLQDPGDVDARVDLIFQERGYWLFLTGHRQGDLRRLVREYGRDPETVYPTGSYPGGNGVYGTDVNVPVDEKEATYNPLYDGCFNRNA